MKHPVNRLILMSDEHTRHVLGCYGNPVVQPPNLDRLATRGTVFTDAYTPVPICVPARASFATGMYDHVTSHWDNATPYTCPPPAGIMPCRRPGARPVRSESCIIAMSTTLWAWISKRLRCMWSMALATCWDVCVNLCPNAGSPMPWPKRSAPGETAYTAYDRSIAEAVARWMKACADSNKPWTLFVSMVAPHFPLIAPQAFYDLYAD
ncbi:sulfatase-like hydrolase/transferase [Aliiroseovarius sp.]|uniref:sulfatase-like hydrolase/transferase n=1 Tax=Aliiroseovarius sp. TaxID=1872442 RepID=UPI003BABA922